MLPLRAFDISSQFLAQRLNNVQFQYQFPPLPAWCEGTYLHNMRGSLRFMRSLIVIAPQIYRWNDLEDNPKVQQWSNVGLASAYLAIALVAAVGIRPPPLASDLPVLEGWVVSLMT